MLVCAAIAIYIFANHAPDKSVEELSEKWAQAPSQFVNIQGMDIHLRDEGAQMDQEPMLLIHGTSASLHTWDGWAGILKEDRRVIRFDLPGFGLTGPEPNNNYTVKRYAELVIALLDMLEIKKAVLVGNSLGGNIAWVTAVLNPDRVSKLVLVDASGYAFVPESVPLAFKLSQNPIASVLLKNVLPRSVVASSVENVYGNLALVNDELIDRYYDLALRAGNRNVLKQRFKQSTPGFLVDKLNTITAPTLIIWGAKDRLIPPKLGAQFLQDIANSELIVFDELGHVPHEENPQATVLAVQRFLAGSAK
jgi:pimeloyl-ACP methyl ester carboxylesterase